MAVCCKFTAFLSLLTTLHVDADSHEGAPMTYPRVCFRWNANHVKQQLVHLTCQAA